MNNESYSAFGRPSDQGGFQPLVGPQSNVVLDFAACLAGYFQPVSEKAGYTPSLDALGLAPLQAVVVYCGPGARRPFLAMSRPQKQLTRGGRLWEMVLFDTPVDRPLGMLGALANESSVESVTQQGRQFTQKATIAREETLAKGLLSPSYHDWSTLRGALARAIYTFFADSSTGPVAVLLPEKLAHLGIPLLIGLDVVLPPRWKARGFAMADFPVKRLGNEAWRNLDWAVMVVPDQCRDLLTCSPVNVCDLRVPPMPEAVTVQYIESLLGSGADAVFAFADWLAIRLAGVTSYLTEEFWYRLAQKLEPPKKSLAQRIADSLCNKDHQLELSEFREAYNQADANWRTRLVNIVVDQAFQCPALAGWLSQSEVQMSPAEMSRATQAFDSLMQAQGPLRDIVG